MPRTLKPGEQYKGRGDGSIPIYVSLPPDAAALLRSLAPTPKSIGKVLARLLYQEQVRQEMRQRVLAAVSEGIGEEVHV